MFHLKLLYFVQRHQIGMRCLDDLFGSDYRIDCDASDRLDSRMLVFLTLL